MVFLVAIENMAQDLQESGLERTIHTLGSWCHPLPSIWLLSSPVISAEAIKDELAPHLSPSCQFLVLPLHPDAAIDNENWALPEVPGWFMLNS